MRLKKITSTVGSLLCLVFINSSYADIVVHSNQFKNADLCDNVAGLWKGEGIVTLGLTCHYLGSANIVKTSPESIQMTVTLDKQSGLVCPQHEDLALSGICKDGMIKIQTDKAHLNGLLSDNAHKAKVTGTVKYNIFNLKVDIDLRK